METPKRLELINKALTKSMYRGIDVQEFFEEATRQQGLAILGMADLASLLVSLIFLVDSDIPKEHRVALLKVALDTPFELVEFDSEPVDKK